MQKILNNKVWIILNPTAGNGKALKEYPRLEGLLKARGLNYEIVLTKCPGDAQEIAAACPMDNETAVVAVGGDGTCNEVINGLLRRKEPLEVPPLFGILPLGRGNDFASSARIPNDLTESVQILVQRSISPLDAGQVTGGLYPEGRYFINGVGIGFDTKVGFAAAKMKYIHSSLSYSLGAIITIARYEPSPVLEIHCDDTSYTLPAAIVSVMNGRRMGGIFFMGPHAVLNDGLFDICTIRRPATRRRLIKLVLSYPKGAQEKFEETVMGRGRNFHLKALEGGMAAHCDGETVCEDGKDLVIRCLPGALRLIGNLET
jgi:YegS/Rv2252/BmrU family lipid kinase